MGRPSKLKDEFAVLARRVQTMLCEGGLQGAASAWRMLNRDEFFRGFLALRAARELADRDLPADCKRIVMDEAFFRLAQALRHPAALRFATSEDDAAFARRFARVAHKICGAAATWLATRSLVAPSPTVGSRQHHVSAVIELELQMAALPIRQRTIGQLVLKGHAIDQIGRQLNLSWLRAYGSWRKGIHRLRQEIRATRKS